MGTPLTEPQLDVIKAAADLGSILWKLQRQSKFMNNTEATKLTEVLYRVYDTLEVYVD